MIQLTIAWTCVGIFIATAVITLLAVVGVLKLADKRYLDRLVKVLLVEVCTVCIGMFSGQIELPETVKNRVEQKGVQKGEQKARDELAPEIEKLNREFELREAKILDYLGKLPPEKVDPRDRDLLKKPLRIDAKTLQLMRPQ